jgi:hypothetical protein
MGTKDAWNAAVKTTYDIKIADWAKIEQQHKIWVERWDNFCANVRCIFVLLLLMAILVFVHNHQVEVQIAASTSLHQVARKITVSDKLQMRALKHEKEVDQINE